MAPQWGRTVSMFGLGAAVGAAVVWGLGQETAPGFANARGGDDVSRAFPPGPGVLRPRASAAAPGAPPTSSGSSPGSATADPDTLTGILARGTDFEQTVALYSLIRDAAVSDLERLLEETALVPGVTDRRAAISILYARYADLDPEAAMAHVAANPSAADAVAVRSIFHAWARSDLEAALAAAEVLDGGFRQHASHAILAARHDLPVERLQAMAQRLETPQVVDQILAQRAVDELYQDPQSAWTEATALEPGRARQLRLGRLLQVWAGRDPLAAMNAVQALQNGQERQGMQMMTMHAWSRQDARGAVDWAMAQAGDPRRDELLAVAISGLAATEPRNAFELARTLDVNQGDQIVGQVLGRWLQDDPAAATQALQSVPESSTRRHAVWQIAVQYAQQDVDGALAWLLTLPADEVDRVAGSVVGTLAAQNPVRASGFVDRLPQSARAGAAQAVVTAWADRDPRAAARWVETSTGPEERPVLTQVLLSHWSRQDPQEALRYARRLPPGGERETAMVGVIQSQRGDLDLAERLYDTLELPETRREAARYLYFRLHERDPQGAERYAWAVPRQGRN